MTDTTQAVRLKDLADWLRKEAYDCEHGAVCTAMDHPQAMQALMRSRATMLRQFEETVVAALAAQAVPAGYVSLPREALRRDVAQAQKDLPYRASYLDWIIQYASPAPAEAQAVPADDLRYLIRRHLANQHCYSREEFCTKLGEILLASSPAPALTEEQERPTKSGWYIVLPPDFDEPTVRAFGRDGQWWIPLGKGDGEDGWLAGRDYKNWVGPIADIDVRQPFLRSTQGGE